MATPLAVADLPPLSGKERHEVLLFLAVLKQKAAGDDAMHERIAELEQHWQLTEDEKEYLSIEVVAVLLANIARRAGQSPTSYIRGPMPASFQ